VYGSVGNWSTHLYGVAFESGRMGDNGGTLQLNVQEIKSDGYLSYNTMKGDNFVVKYQHSLGENTRMTLFATYNDIKTALSDSVSGATLAQAALFGKSYGLNNDPTSQGYYGYNQVHKKTDFEYFRLQSDWGNGIQTDNNLYSYYYDNQTFSGIDASGYMGTGQPIAAGAVANNGKFYGVKLTSGVPGYDKLNHYRVTGDIFKVTDQLAAGLLRAGIWYDHADTNRHNFGMDISTNTYATDFTTKGLKSNQKSGWNQYQPFAEFEWSVDDSTVVTPGVKYMNFTRSVDAIFNQGSKVAANFSETYRDSLPFLTVNHMFDHENSVYVQYAKGMQVPTLDQLQVATPANNPSPQTTINYQLGAVHKSDRFMLSADVYYIDFNNMIGSTIVSGQTVFFNQGGAVYKGFEAEGAYVLGAGFSVYANGSINSAKYKANNAAGFFGDIATAPKTTAALGLEYNRGPWNSSLIYKLIGPQYAVANQPSAYKIDSYGNTDLNVSYTMSDLGATLKSLKVQFSAFNLTDSQKVTAIAQGSTTALDQYQWQAPRSYMLSLKGTF
ncbi:MAG: TonB-dependent receptor, partial [Burkholderiales bacterium]|nr:TonB-dependent receptor [Burkholderiales bacterium]